jgi:hypothetical protein
MHKVSLVLVSFCSNTGSIRDDPFWTSRKNNLERIELSSTNKVSLVLVFSCSITSREYNLERVRLSVKIKFSFKF